MSFHYPPINGNGLSTMLPLLTNLTNGQSFMSSLASNQAVTSAGLMAAAAAAAAHHSNVSENALDFNRNHQKLFLAPGAGPMDLESLNDNRESQTFLQSPTGSELNLTTSTSSLQRKLTTNCDDNTEKNFSTYNPCDAMYNMGIPSQNLMNIMQSNVMNMMRDTSSMAQTLPQFSLINHHQLPALQSASASNNNNNLSESTAASSTASSSNNSIVAKETITCKSCILMPPNPNAPPPSTRERPQGCRTVFVGGLPENITEDVIREVFEPCGEITTLRLSKKNFCHIRFVFEASVDSAIYLSGFRIRINNNQNDSANCGRLHVDFAQARDDQYEYECKQRQLTREQRHRERIERDRLRPSSPPPVIHFSEHEASSVSERIKQDETFFKAVQILITWLERGDCSKKNSNIFYSMIQSTNSHIRRLLNERTTYEDELNKAKEMHRKHMQSLSTQLSQIEKVFGAASHKKVWDHFTKAQRKNIDQWKKQSSQVHVPPESLESHDTDEMDMSDDEESASYPRYGKRYRRDSAKQDPDTKRPDTAAAYPKNSKETMSDVKDQQLKVLQETIRNLQTLLLESKTKERQNLNQIQNLELKLKQLNAKELMQKPKIHEDSDPDTDSSDSDKDVVCVDDVKESTTNTNTDTNKNLIEKCAQHVDNIDGNEARLIGLMSAFLVVYPFGASLDNISTYVRQMLIGIDSNVKDIETILRKYKNIFCEISMPLSSDNDYNATTAIKWKFCAFDAKKSESNSVECD